MDKELRTAIRSIKASGQMDQLLEGILYDASWDTIISMQRLVDRVRKTYHSKRILRAMEIPSKELWGFRLAIQLPVGEVPMEMKSIDRHDDHVMFKGELNVESPYITQAVALYDDTGFCFGLRPYHNGTITTRGGDLLIMNYKLEATNGIV